MSVQTKIPHNRWKLLLLVYLLKQKWPFRLWTLNLHAYVFFHILRMFKQWMVNLIVLVYISPFDIKLKICYNSPLRSYIIDFSCLLKPVWQLRFFTFSNIGENKFGNAVLLGWFNQVSGLQIWNMLSCHRMDRCYCFLGYLQKLTWPSSTFWNLSWKF